MLNHYKQSKAPFEDRMADRFFRFHKHCGKLIEEEKDLEEQESQLNMQISEEERKLQDLNVRRDMVRRRRVKVRSKKEVCFP